MQGGLNAPSEEEKTQSLDEEEAADDARYFNLLKVKFKHALHADPD